MCVFRRTGREDGPGWMHPYAVTARSTQRPSGWARQPVVSATLRPPGDSLVAPGIDELRGAPDFVTPASSAGSRLQRSLPCFLPRNSCPFLIPVGGTRETGGSGVSPLHSQNFPSGEKPTRSGPQSLTTPWPIPARGGRPSRVPPPFLIRGPVVPWAKGPAGEIRRLET